MPIYSWNKPVTPVNAENMGPFNAFNYLFYRITNIR